jgi:very-short-patch-repair endonuclease
MAREIDRRLSSAAWRLARRQHWVVTRRQLLAIGYTEEAIDHRIEVGRLHPVHAGVYAVGRAALTREGYFIAAVLACGDAATLSHESAGALWEIRPYRHGPVRVSVPADDRRRRPGIKVHRRRTRIVVTRKMGIRVTTPVETLVDLATRLEDPELERAVNEAVNRDLIDPERLRQALDQTTHRPGVRKLAKLLDHRTFAVTETMLEQRFLPLVRAAGLPLPQTQAHVNGYRVDFYWPDLRLVVEADSLRFHRTAAQQAKDRLRDQTHAAAGLTTLRFTHAQVWFDPSHVRATLSAVGAA